MDQTVWLSFFLTKSLTHSLTWLRKCMVSLHLYLSTSQNVFVSIHVEFSRHLLLTRMMCSIKITIQIIVTWATRRSIRMQKKCYSLTHAPISNSGFRYEFEPRVQNSTGQEPKVAATCWLLSIRYTMEDGSQQLRTDLRRRNTRSRSHAHACAHARTRAQTRTQEISITYRGADS